MIQKTKEEKEQISRYSGIDFQVLEEELLTARSKGKLCTHLANVVIFSSLSAGPYFLINSPNRLTFFSKFIGVLSLHCFLSFSYGREENKIKNLISDAEKTVDYQIRILSGEISPLNAPDHYSLDNLLART